MAHPTRNKSGNNGTRSPLRVSVTTNQCVNCGSTFGGCNLNLCAQEFGDLQTHYAHAQLPHLLVPAPTIQTEQHTKPARRPRRHKQHSRDGHEREPRVRQERRRWRTGAAKPKTAPTHREPHQTRRWNQRLGGGGKPKADSKPNRRAPNTILKATLKTHQNDARLALDGVGHFVGQSVEPRNGSRAEPRAERVR